MGEHTQRPTHRRKSPEAMAKKLRKLELEALKAKQKEAKRRYKQERELAKRKKKQEHNTLRALGVAEETFGEEIGDVARELIDAQLTELHEVTGLGAPLVASQPTTAASVQGPTANTAQGKVAGLNLLGVHTWRGIPFGAPTGGAGRFSAPKPREPWSGTRPCYRYGEVAPQPVIGPNDRIRGSEDCLNLDIVRPDTEEGDLPVVVYFHGGSFVIGSSHEQLLRGHYLAEAMNVVYVSINFRLGALGYLDMRSLGDDCVATPAIFDQILALKWIRSNIAEFGGNPDNVTIMGESAGGAAVLTLMCVPAARGLFHRVVAQSPPIAMIHSRAQSTMWTRNIVRRAGLAPEASLREVRGLDVGELVRAGQSMMWRSRELMNLNSCYAATVDNKVLLEHPLETFAAGRQTKVPLLIGTNVDELSFAMSFYIRQKARARAGRRMLAAFDPEGVSRVLAAYNGAESRRDFADLLADALFWAPATLVAGYHSAVANTYKYRFDFSPTLMRKFGFGAMHSTELTPIFGDMTASRMSSLNSLGGREDLFELREEMQAHWSEFIHTGAPGLDWPRYTSPSDTMPGRATLIFDSTSHVVYDPRGYRRRAWEGYNMLEWGAGRPELLAELGLDDPATQAIEPRA